MAFVQMSASLGVGKVYINVVASEFELVAAAVHERGDVKVWVNHVLGAVSVVAELEVLAEPAARGSSIQSEPGVGEFEFVHG